MGVGITYGSSKHPLEVVLSFSTILGKTDRFFLNYHQVCGKFQSITVGFFVIPVVGTAGA
jgi:hypothetical protein